MVTTIDAATVDDLTGLRDVYNQSMTTSNSNFDSRPASIDERRDWFARFSSSGPHRLVVAREAGAVLGYACSNPFRDHEAFRETVEVSVSLHSASRGRGIGTKLYSSLFNHLANERVHVALAGIALPNDASVALHRRFGFTEVGIFTEYAMVNGRYISSVWMQRLFEPKGSDEPTTIDA